MPNVIIYTTPSCPWCLKTKEFFKRNNITYTEKNVAEDADAAAEAVEKSGQRGVPIIDVDGKIIIGFNEPELRKVLKIKK